MKTKKPKRIRARRAMGNDGRPYYAIDPFDVRALAEQFVQCSVEFHKLPEPDAENRERMIASTLYALKRAGMTPGKERAK